MLYRKSSFIGDLIFGIILIGAIVLILYQVNNNQIKQIAKIDKQYGVDGDTLIPYDSDGYIAMLTQINNNDYTTPIIQYIRLYEDSKKLNNKINLLILTGNNCVPKSISFEVDSMIQKQQNVVALFEAGNRKKLNQIYWDKYLDILKSTTTYSEIEVEIIKKPVCN